MRVEHSLEIARPPDEVFAYLADPQNLPEWQSSSVGARLASGEPLGVGSRIEEVRRVLGRRLESTVEVTEHVPGRRFSLRALSGPLRFEVRHTLEPAAGGGATRLFVEMEGDPGGLGRLAEPLIRRQGQRQLETDFASLKRLLESR